MVAVVVMVVNHAESAFRRGGEECAAEGESREQSEEFLVVHITPSFLFCLHCVWQLYALNLTENLRSG